MVLVSQNNLNTFDFVERASVQFGMPESSRCVIGPVSEFVKGCIKSQVGSVDLETIDGLLETIVAADQQAEGLIKGRAFHYPGVSGIAEFGTERAAESTVSSATANAAFMISFSGIESFLAQDPRRKTRIVEWTVPVTERYRLKIRGGSGASCFSIDTGIGYEESDGRYHEFWRSGIDTEHHGDLMGARIIRTGSAVRSSVTDKVEEFRLFRKEMGIMPHRLLGLLDLYLMHTMAPDYVLALSTNGARNLSTLGRSKGGCDYDAVFKDIGFRDTPDRYYLAAGTGEAAVYDALERAQIKTFESDVLDLCVNGINALVDEVAAAKGIPIIPKLCSDDRKEIIEKALGVHLRKS